MRAKQNVNVPRKILAAFSISLHMRITWRKNVERRRVWWQGEGERGGNRQGEAVAKSRSNMARVSERVGDVAHGEVRE